MKKYRIIKRDSCFVIQERFLFVFFWTDAEIDPFTGFYFGYDSLYEAEQVIVKWKNTLDPIEEIIGYY